MGSTPDRRGNLYLTVEVPSKVLTVLGNSIPSEEMWHAQAMRIAGLIQNAVPKESLHIPPAQVISSLESRKTILRFVIKKRAGLRRLIQATRGEINKLLPAYTDMIRIAADDGLGGE